MLSGLGLSVYVMINFANLCRSNAWTGLKNSTRFEILKVGNTLSLTFVIVCYHLAELQGSKSPHHNIAHDCKFSGRACFAIADSTPSVTLSLHVALT